MEACPAKITVETENELWKLVELHALLAHEENAEEWDDETLVYLKPLVKIS